MTVTTAVTVTAEVAQTIYNATHTIATSTPDVGFWSHLISFLTNWI